jgi:hypothetical protein
MRFKNIFLLILACLIIFSLQASCSNKQDSKKETGLRQIREAVEKDSARARARQNRKEDGPERQKQMAVADACSEKFNACSSNCRNSSCEDQCLKALSSCEKGLPLELKTVKQ